jgi:hypothetical protein
MGFYYIKIKYINIREVDTVDIILFILMPAYGNAIYSNFSINKILLITLF